jgi:C-terminal processing protease CtpA/Prc
VRALLILVAVSFMASAQLTREQKIADFQNLAALYSKHYSPYEWKKQQFGFDLLDIQPWLQRAADSRSDLDFYDICIEYVASLRDTHDVFAIPSTFVASLGFSVDIYDGKVLIDSIDRSRLPVRDYGFEIGDELIEVDGKPVEQLLAEYAKYAIQGNERSTRRRAASRIVTRPQNRMPRAHQIGDAAQLVVRRMNDSLETFNVPWRKTGIPLEVGPVPTPKRLAAASMAADDYMQPLRELQHSGTDEPYAELGNGVRNPIYALPSNFQQRLGRVAADWYFSGTFEVAGQRIGYIRIPTYAVGTPTAPLPQFDAEIAYFEANTDGLLIDQMRNPGGIVCYGESVAARLIPQPFRPIGFELRATWSHVNTFNINLQTARNANAPRHIIQLYEAIYNDLSVAYNEYRGLTGPLPLCQPGMIRQPATDSTGKPITYTKPIIMIIDEFSTSTADSVPAMLQDASRALLVGMRSNGAGGTNVNMSAGTYAEGTIGMTRGTMTRSRPIVTGDHPTAYYIENIGVRPDVEIDYMTRENLLNRGATFFNAVTQAAVEHIRRNR